MFSWKIAFNTTMLILLDEYLSDAIFNNEK